MPHAVRHCRAIRLGALILGLALFPFWSEAQNRLVIEGGTLIDGTGKPPLKDSVIVIEGRQIAAVGQRGAVTVPPGARIVPASGKFILPGLIDLHVHWQDWMPELFLAHGVTSVVDLSSGDWQLAQKELLTTGRLRGPRMFNAPLTMGGRLLWDTPPNLPIESLEMAHRVVREAAGKKEFSLTKAYTELTPDQLQAIVEESHKAGRHVIAHLGSLDARQAAESGVDALAHASGVALATITNPAKAEELRTFARLGIAVDYPLYLMYHAFMDPAKTDGLIALLVQKKVRMEPDLVNTSRWAAGAAGRLKTWIAEDMQLLQDPNLSYIPQNHRDRMFYSKPLEELNAQQREQLRRGYENLQTFLRRFLRAGGTVLAGTDTASFVLPGISLHRELELLVDAGLTPMQAIQAATMNNAEFLQDSGLGTIEPGKLADLIVVREDPLADIRNTRTVDVVIKDGQVVDNRYHADFTNPFPRPPREVRFPHPKPSIRAIFPFQSKEPGKEVTVTVEGSNFVDESVVEFDGVAVPTTPVKSSLVRETIPKPNYTQLTATVPARLVNRIGTYTVIVKNPPPEGGTSNVLNFFVAR